MTITTAVYALASTAGIVSSFISGYLTGCRVERKKTPPHVHAFGRWDRELEKGVIQSHPFSGKFVNYAKWIQRRKCTACGFVEMVDI